MGLFMAFYLVPLVCILFLCQYHTVLMTVALKYNLKSGKLIPPAPFFFLKTDLSIWGLLCFHMNCEIFCSSSVKNAIGNLTGITLNLQIAFGSIVIFTILILLPKNIESLFVYVIFYFFFIYFCSDLYDFFPSTNFEVFFVLLFPVVLGVNLGYLFEVFLVS